MEKSSRRLLTDNLVLHWKLSGHTSLFTKIWKFTSLTSLKKETLNHLLLALLVDLVSGLGCFQARPQTSFFLPLAPLVSCESPKPAPHAAHTQHSGDLSPRKSMGPSQSSPASSLLPCVKPTCLHPYWQGAWQLTGNARVTKPAERKYHDLWPAYPKSGFMEKILAWAWCLPPPFLVFPLPFYSIVFHSLVNFPF